MAITEREAQEIESANSSGRTPVVLIHGLWMLAESWSAWRPAIEQADLAPVALDWPGDQPTIEAARANPDTVAGVTIGRVAEHVSEVIGALTVKPAVIGHSFGGLLAQIAAGRGQTAVTVALDPAPFRGVLPLPLSALRFALPVLANPANRFKAVTLSFEQWHFGWTNALSQDEARQLYDRWHVPAPAAPLFQAATANAWPFTDLKVPGNPDRGPLLIVAGGADHAVPPSMVKAAYRIQHKHYGITELAEFGDRGHSLAIDSGWEEIAETALAFITAHG